MKGSLGSLVGSCGLVEAAGKSSAVCEAERQYADPPIRRYADTLPLEVHAVWSTRPGAESRGATGLRKRDRRLIYYDIYGNSG
jgi:hypothetical protein